MGDLEKQERGNGFEGEADVGEGNGLLLDFDLLCSTVALQTQGRWKELNGDDDEMEGMEFGEAGVLRMWEGEVLDCFEDRRVAFETTCCPCYRFGKNMRRAGFGPSFVQGAVYFILAMGLFSCWIAFIITKRRCFMYTGVAVTILFGAYLGFFRTQIRKKFNIRGTDSSLDDCVYHLACPCCTLCQESRTLEMNNVQDGNWHGRGDTICIGSYNEGSTGLFELVPPPLVSTKTPDLFTKGKDISGTGGS